MGRYILSVSKQKCVGQTEKRDSVSLVFNLKEMFRNVIEKMMNFKAE